MKTGTLLLFYLATTGCASVSSPSEYVLYRRARVAPAVEDRLKASADYLHRYPEGAFAADLAPTFARDELLYYRSKRDSITGLETYLRALPVGPHGIDAAQRLSALRAKGRRGDELMRQALATDARLGKATAARVRVRDELAGWTRRFLDPSAFRSPLAEAGADIVIPWALGLPSPHCVARFDKAHPKLARKCVKVESLDYIVVGKEGGEARVATIEIAIEEDAMGRPLGISIGGPDLFLRLEEAAVVRAFDPHNSEHRIGAVARAVELVRAEFEARVSRDASCIKPVVAPVVLDLACHGVNVTARAGTEAEDDDVVTVRPE